MQIINGIYLPDHDTHFADKIRSNPLVDGKGTYQLAKLRAALSVDHRRGLAIDVGAHVGLWTRVLALNFDRVIAFEPCLDHAECLRKNVGSHNNVSIYEIALGNSSSELGMKCENSDIATASVCCNNDVMEFMIPIRRIDDFEYKHVDFIKIDTEGYETMVLRGGEETINRDRPVIVIEQKKRRVLQYESDKLAGVHLLESWGAHIEWEMSGDYCMIWRV